MDWFRWWHGTLTDPKFGWVKRKSGQPFTAVISLWVALLEHASSVTESDEPVTESDVTVTHGDVTVTGGDMPVMRGSVSRFDCTVFDVLFDLDDGSCQKIYDAFVAKGMIENGMISRWEQRQPKREDSSAERMRRYRARKKAAENGEEIPDHVTQSDAQVTRGDDKRRVDKRKNRSKQPKSNDLPTLASASRLPNDWVLPRSYGTWAKEFDKGWSDDYIRELGEAFKDYWTALPDNRFAKKTDWFATWRNFLRQRVKPSTDAAGKPTRGRNWYSTEQGIIDKAADLGFVIPAGMRWPDVIEKIIAIMEENDRKGEAAPAPADQPKTAVPLEPEQSKVSPEEAKAAREAALAMIQAGKQQRRGAPSA